MLTLQETSTMVPKSMEATVVMALSGNRDLQIAKIDVETAKNDLSSAWSAYTPKLDLTIPFGKESLINSDSDNTNMDYYELDAKISQTRSCLSDVLSPPTHS